MTKNLATRCCANCEWMIFDRGHYMCLIEGHIIRNPHKEPNENCKYFRRLFREKENRNEDNV